MTARGQGESFGSWNERGGITSRGEVGYNSEKRAGGATIR